MSGNADRFLNKCATLSLKEWALLIVSKNAKLSESALLKLSALRRRLEKATL